MISRSFVLLAIFVMAGAAPLGASDAPCFQHRTGAPLASSSASTQGKDDQLIVYGKGFAFSAREPAGWRGDTENAAAFDADALLHEDGQPNGIVSGMIRIRVNDKVDENTASDMAADVREYQNQYPKVRFKNLAIKTHYLCLGKLFYISGEFHEYVAYVNPGPTHPVLFSVSMNTGKSEATARELFAFETVVQSLKLMNP